MTTRARMMLDALEDGDGSATRREIWQHAGRFYLTNNAAAELRRAGVDVEYDRETDTYRLLDEARLSPYSPSGASLVEQTDGQYALEVVS